MNLERIELHGFKSFADKTVIPLKDGFTAIIGPNGCGKSNVAESIRWTLGEQSAKSLRGKSMQDVIFAGTEKRRSMSYCEVSLVFNNEGSKIFKNLPYDEVSISRKLDRSGLSEYSINNTRCRMMDVINLLHDTGIGKEGYSIIGQGRIDEILSAKPEDRRNIFEEAAGISKFRAQRDQAERKLEKTSLNLQTANEVIAEIERQLVPLRRQAETAKKWFDLKDTLKRQEVNLFIYQHENNEGIKKKVLDRLESATNDLKLKESALSGCTAEYERILSESMQIDSTYEAQNAELLSLKVDAEKLTGQANLLHERIEHLNADKNRINGELADVDKQLVVADTLIKSGEKQKEEELAAFLQLSNEYQSQSAKLEKLSKSIAGSENDLETSNAEYVNSLRELGTLKTNFSAYVAEKGINEARLKSLNELLVEKKHKLDSESTNLSIYDANVKKAKEELRAKLGEYNEALSTKIEAQEAIKALDEDIVGLNSKLGHAEGNLRLQMSIKDEYTGFQEAVRKLMVDAKTDQILKSHILGVVAEVINVPKEYETAVEYALGGALQNVLVEDERDASYLITHLKQRGHGRVTFRPRTACRPHALQGSDREVLREQGCLGVAADLVTCADEFDDFVQTLLGSTVIVDTMMTAERLWKKYNRSFKIVTLDGEIYARGGEVTGGSRRSQTSGILSQESLIEQAKANLERLRSNIAKLQNQRESFLSSMSECDEITSSINATVGELRITISLNEEKSNACLAQVEDLKKEISEGAEEYESAKQRVRELDEMLSSIDKLEADVKDKESTYNQLVSASKVTSGEQKSVREDLNALVMDLRVKLAQSQSNLDSIDADIYRSKRDKSNIEEEKLDLIAELKTVENQLNNILNAPEKTSFNEADAKRIKELEQTIGSLSERKKALSEKLVELDRTKTRLYDEKNEANERIIRAQGTLESIDQDTRRLAEHILEDYDLTYNSALEYKDENFVFNGSKTAITDLKREISRLGEVNPLAVETLKETEERHAECVTQRDDIQAAYDDIKNVISELTVEMTDKFVTAFEQIQSHFKDVFSQLFGGGKGELRLDTSETDDPLEAGIEIFAQPPGKSLKHISLLSGGERALTAISILFSILKLKPMPFCVLDEIEAALDESNANLFAEFITKFSDYTQFIVITHRRPTMRHANTIFGVTMEEKGVSKIVSIELEDAIKQAVEKNEADE